MANYEYWKNNLEKVFGNNGLELTDFIIADICTIAEMETEYCSDHTGHKPDKEKIELKEELEKLKHKSAMFLHQIRQRIADKNGIDVKFVSISQEGTIYID